MSWYQFTRSYALLVGVAFTLAGIGGFVSFLTPPATADAPTLLIETSYGLLLGLFPINLIHNLFHLAIGVFGLLAYRDLIPLRNFMRGFGIILALLAILGMIPTANTLGGYMPIYGHDVWLHGVEAVVALGLGFLGSMQPRSMLTTPTGRP